MTGRGYRNLYRPVFYRTAGGCCVCSREMDDGGIKHYNMHEMCRNVLQCILQCSLNVICIFIKKITILSLKRTFLHKVEKCVVL